MEVSKNFDLREFVPPSVWNQFGSKSIWFVNPWCYQFAQFMKDFLSKEYGEEVTVVINSWHYGGNRKWSCLRTYQYIKDQIKKGIKTATLSQHIGGQANAIDFKAYIKSSKKEIKSDTIRDLILKNEARFLKNGVTTIEGGRWAPTWVHCDCRPTGLDNILIVGA